MLFVIIDGCQLVGVNVGRGVEAFFYVFGYDPGPILIVMDAVHDA